MLLDTEGYAIPFTNDDAVIESGVDDPSYGDSESWPDLTDQDRYEPTPQDEAWLVRQSAVDDDWPADAVWSRRLEELHQASEYMDRLEAMHHVDGDQAVRDAWLPVG
jgi:hypothetical protein